MTTPKKAAPKKAVKKAAPKKAANRLNESHKGEYKGKINAKGIPPRDRTQ